MKRTIILAVSLLFAAFFTVPAFGQVQPATKIGWIITSAFADEKEGITKYVNAQRALDTEMKPRVTELQALKARIDAIAAELNKPANPAVPVAPASIAAKQDEGARLEREFKFKQEEAQAVFGKRQGEVLGPIQSSIFQALQDYAKEKKYDVIIDISTLGQENAPNPILFLAPSANVTKDFITYYNTKPATTATTATPK